MKPLLRRVLYYLLTAWAAISINFLLPRLMPGDPVDRLLLSFKGRLSPDSVAALRVLFGQPDTSLWTQYVDYWRSLFHGNFGVSIAYYPSAVVDVVGGSIWWTLILITFCTVMAFVIGTSLGMLVGWKRGSWLDGLVPVTTFISSIPYFWFAIVMALVFAITLRWLPLSGGYAVGESIGLNASFLGSAAYHAILPAVTIITASVGGWLLGMRNMMVTTVSEDYVRMAQAKGLTKRRVMTAYAARNAILPSFSSFAMSLGFVVGGSIVTEIVFNYPGIGTVLFRAASTQDYPLMQAIFLVITLMVLVANLAADIAYTFLDPRTRQEA